MENFYANDVAHISSMKAKRESHIHRKIRLCKSGLYWIVQVHIYYKGIKGESWIANQWNYNTILPLAIRLFIGVSIKMIWYCEWYLQILTTRSSQNQEAWESVDVVALVMVKIRYEYGLLFFSIIVRNERLRLRFYRKVCNLFHRFLFI